MAAFRSWAEVRFGAPSASNPRKRSDAPRPDGLRFSSETSTQEYEKGPGRCRGLEFIGGEKRSVLRNSVVMLVEVEGATEAQGYLHSDTASFLPRTLPISNIFRHQITDDRKVPKRVRRSVPHARNAGECTCSGRTPSATNRAAMPCSQGIALIMRKSKGTRSG
jgi:hypothetical protein